MRSRCRPTKALDKAFAPDYLHPITRKETVR